MGEVGRAARALPTAEQCACSPRSSPAGPAMGDRDTGRCAGTQVQPGRGETGCGPDSLCCKLWTRWDLRRSAGLEIQARPAVGRHGSCRSAKGAVRWGAPKTPPAPGAPPSPTLAPACLPRVTTRLQAWKLLESSLRGLGAGGGWGRPPWSGGQSPGAEMDLTRIFCFWPRSHPQGSPWPDCTPRGPHGLGRTPRIPPWPRRYPSIPRPPGLY